MAKKSKEMDTEMDTEVEKSWTTRLFEKGQKSPFLIASLIGLGGITGYGAYNFRKKKLSLQIYLIQLRVAAQGTAVACLTIGMIYHMVKKYVLHEKTNE